MPNTITTSEAAKLLNCTERTIRNMIQRGSIHAIKTDPTARSRYNIPKAEIDRLLALRNRKPKR